MIPVRFYRDDDYIYFNNPDGLTKKIPISDFEAIMSGEGELPTYSSSTNGKVLSVDSDGDLVWASLPPAELPAYSSSNSGEVLSVDSDGDLDWISLEPSGGGELVVTFTSSDGGNTWTCDKTYSEIMEAYNDKLFIRGYECSIDGQNEHYTPIEFEDAGAWGVYFHRNYVSVSGEPNTWQYYGYYMAANGSISLDTATYTLTTSSI